MRPLPRPAPVRVFTYGSLIDARRLGDVLGHVYSGQRLPARLAGYRRHETSAYAYPFLVPDAQAGVDGVLLMDLADADLPALDRYEEVDLDVYRRESVVVELLGGGPPAVWLEAFAYVAGPRLLGSSGTRLGLPSAPARTRPILRRAQ